MMTFKSPKHILTLMMQNRLAQGSLAEILVSLTDLYLKQNSKNLTPKQVADSILKLSDFYIENPDSPTPWQEPWAKIAYLSYFNLLNSVRLDQVYKRGEQSQFFEGLTNFVDFGSGLGAASWPLLNRKITDDDSSTKNLNHFFHIEISSLAQKTHQELIQLWMQNLQPLKTTANHTFIRDSSELPKLDLSKTLVSFSYSKTELSKIPEWALKCEAILIAEPATSQDGRKLLDTRAQLIEKGFYIWAPCLHQNSCPLLTQSKTDWCHDRVFWEMPEKFAEIQAWLPIRNQTLSTSYLLARKTKPQDRPTNLGRLTGDLLVEKGKSRQMICRGPNREYLTWMHKEKINQPELFRGKIAVIPSEAIVVSNEIRVKEPVISDS